MFHKNEFGHWYSDGPMVMPHEMRTDVDIETLLTQNSLWEGVVCSAGF